MSTAIEVLIVIDHLDAGGAQEFVYQLVRALPADAVRFSVCALRSGGLYRSKLEGLGVQVVVLAPNRSLINLPLILFRLAKLLASKRFRVVHTLLQGAFLFATPIAWLLRRPCIHTIVSIRGQMQWWYFPLMALFQRLVGRYLTPLPIELRDSGVRSEKIIPVGAAIDLSEMLILQHNPSQHLEPYDLRDAFPVALSVGRLHPDKGHEYAIQAWPQVLMSYPQARLLIVGGGDDVARLRGIVEKLGLADSVLLTGHRSDLASLYARADLLLRASVNEGANFAVTQGMAAGLPVIGFDTGASSEVIVPEQNGLLVPLRDSTALSKAIVRLSTERDLAHQIGEAGRATMGNYYDFQALIRTYSTCYRELSLASARR